MPYVQSMTDDSTTASIDTSGCSAPGVVDLAHVAGQPHRVRERQVGARPARAQHELARLDDAPAVAPGERREVGGHGERDLGRLARLELDPGVADQPLHRAHDAGDRVVQVELHDLGARAVAGVAHGDAHASTVPSVAISVASPVERVPVERRVDSPWPNGNAAVGSTFETSLARASGAAR